MHSAIRLSQRLLTAAATAVALLMAVLPVPEAQAANIPMYDNSITRQRVVNDQSLSPLQLYLSSPWYVHLPGQSLSTPTIVGNTLYQYTYQGASGSLYAIQMPTLDTTAVLHRHPQNPPPYQTAQPVITHTLTFSVGAAAADSQDSLATSQGWQSIAVGQYLYAWPQGQWPASPSTAVHTEIWPSPGNDQFMVDMNPLITPPVRATVYRIPSMHTELVRLPMDVACSWDGGCTATPLGALAGTVAVPIRYHTTQDFPSNTDTAITSDPAYIASEPLFHGAPAVVFGVASWTHPRLELLDLETGKARAIGAGVIASPVADAVMVDTVGSQTLIVAHDEYGTVYEFNLHGQLAGVNPPLTKSPHVELGEDGAVNYGLGPTVLQPADAAQQMLIAPLSQSNTTKMAFVSYTGLSSPSTLYGSMPDVSWCQSNNCRYESVWSFTGMYGPGLHMGPGIVLMSNAAIGPTYVNKPTYSNGGELIAARTSPYVGVLIDGGAQHDLVSWTNGAPGGGGALELWVPVNYTLEASVPPTVPSGGQVTVTGVPIPADVTHDRISAASCNDFSTNEPVQMELTSSLGTSGWLPLYRTGLPSVSYPWSTWTGKYTLPPNTTGSPVKWTGTVYGVDKFCQPAQRTFTFTERANPVPVQSGGPLTLSLNPILYGQHETATLSPDAPAAPTPPQGTVTAWSWKVASASLFWPKVDSRWTFSVPYYPEDYGNSATMPLGQHSADYQFVEDWWNGGGQTLSGENVPILSAAGSYTPGAIVPFGQPIPPLTSPVKAVYTLKADYSYEWTTYTTSWEPNPVCKTENPPSNCNSKGETPIRVPHTHTASGSVTLPQQTATVQITVDGTAVDRVGAGG